MNQSDVRDLLAGFTISRVGGRSGASAWQIACGLMNLIKVNANLKQGSQ